MGATIDLTPVCGHPVGGIVSHKIRIHCELGDSSPWLSIVCPFEGNDPKRPCLVVDCSRLVDALDQWMGAA